MATADMTCSEPLHPQLHSPCAHIRPLATIATPPAIASSRPYGWPISCMDAEASTPRRMTGTASNYTLNCANTQFIAQTSMEVLLSHVDTETSGLQVICSVRMFITQRSR
jgi:hypothetical protein